MKKLIFLLAMTLITATASFGQSAITLTQYQPVIQPMIAPYWDFVSLNQVAATRSAFVVSDSSLFSVQLVAAQNGSTVLLKALAGDTIVLPASATLPIGARFTIVIAYSTTSVSHSIKTNGSDVFYGTLYEMSSSTAESFTSTANKSIIMSTTTTCGLRGGKIDVLYIGGGRWSTTGLLYGSGSVATAFAN